MVVAGTSSSTTTNKRLVRTVPRPASILQPMLLHLLAAQSSVVSLLLHLLPLPPTPRHTMGRRTDEAVSRRALADEAVGARPLLPFLLLLLQLPHACHTPPPTDDGWSGRWWRLAVSPSSTRNWGTCSNIGEGIGSRWRMSIS